MSTPRLSIGLPVYNGEKHLSDAIDSLLDQSYQDFELVISDNGSTDRTEEICQHYVAIDNRVRYVRQPTNIGIAGNHNAAFKLSRGELFKWAADDDLYDREFLQGCVDALDEHPDAVLATSWTALFDGEEGHPAQALQYSLNTGATDPVERFRSMLFGTGGDDDYGVIRSEVLRRISLYNSFHNPDRVLITELSLHGPFYHIPNWLYFRREHPGRSTNVDRGIRAFCASYDSRRANRLRHPLVRLVAEYILAHFRAVHNAPLTAGQKVRCYRAMGEWLASRAIRVGRGRIRQGDPVTRSHEIPGIPVLPGNGGTTR